MDFLSAIARTFSEMVARVAVPDMRLCEHANLSTISAYDFWNPVVLYRNRNVIKLPRPVTCQDCGAVISSQELHSLSDFGSPQALIDNGMAAAYLTDRIKTAPAGRQAAATPTA